MNCNSVHNCALGDIRMTKQNKRRQDVGRSREISNAPSHISVFSDPSPISPGVEHIVQVLVRPTSGTWHQSSRQGSNYHRNWRR